MPEISESDYRQFVAYQQLGTPQEITKKVGDLENDNKAQRDQIRELKEKVPKDGEVAVPKEKAEALAAYEELGKPEDLKAKVEKVPQLEGEIAKRDREGARAEAAKALGIEGSGLAPFAGSDTLTYEVREEEVEANGKKEKRPVAYVKDAEGKEYRLAEYGKATWGRGFEALITAEPPKTGTRYTPQTGREDPRPKSDDPVQAKIDRMKEQAAARPNPLVPKQHTS